MEIPENIYNNILINYMSIRDNYGISKYIDNKRNIKKNKAINTINKYIYKYILDLRISMETADYDTPKIYYKKFYPLKYRRALMISALKKDLDDDYKKELYNDIIDIIHNPNHLVTNFNKFIDYVVYDDLSVIV
jgi:hypothetical protein